MFMKYTDVGDYIQDLTDISEIDIELELVKMGKCVLKVHKLKRLTQNNLSSICNCSSNHEKIRQVDALKYVKDGNLEKVINKTYKEK